jgi:hypothetical protein
MPNPRLTEEQRDKLFEPLFASTKAELERLSGGDPQVLWALRRKLTKELGYLERSDPQKRTALKREKHREQNGRCAICGHELAQHGSELDRLEAFCGYTIENTRLVHHDCHIRDQQRKQYT